MRWRAGTLGAVVVTIVTTEPASAHGPGTASEQLATVLLLVVTAIGWLYWVRRPWRLPDPTLGQRTFTWLAPPLAVGLLVAALTAGSWAPKTPVSARRPVATARLRILEPHSGGVVGHDVTIRLELIGGHLVAGTSTHLLPDQGHIHLSVDGAVVAQTFGLTDQLHGLSPGGHIVTAEFVALDHGPFRNRVLSVVSFIVAA